MWWCFIAKLSCLLWLFLMSDAGQGSVPNPIWKQHFAMFCNVSQCFTKFHNVSHCFSMFCNVLQCLAMFCNVLQCFAMFCNVLQCFAMFCNVLQCFSMFYNVFQCFVMFCNVLQCFRIVTFNVIYIMSCCLRWSKNIWVKNMWHFGFFGEQDNQCIHRLVSALAHLTMCYIVILQSYIAMQATIPSECIQ